MQHHTRKFISRNGEYIDNSKTTLKSGALYFWGEYEPATEALIKSKSYPNAVHDKLIPVRGMGVIPANALNTDPYVFGKHFKYICCQMGNRKHIPGDMILLGHFVNDPKGILFDLDTVIVIKEAVEINYSRNTTQYYKASIEPIVSKKKEVFYKGYNPSENKYFSFVPCLSQQAPKPMPRLDLKKYGFVVKNGWRSYVAASIPFTTRIWNQVVNDVVSGGWLLGTHFDNI